MVAVFTAFLIEKKYIFKADADKTVKTEIGAAESGVSARLRIEIRAQETNKTQGSSYKFNVDYLKCRSNAGSRCPAGEKPVKLSSCQPLVTRRTAILFSTTVTRTATTVTSQT